MAVVYVKACDCKATSSTHQFRVTPVPYEEHGIPNIAMTRCAYYPQPSCDECGRPWVVDEPPTAA